MVVIRLLLTFLFVLTTGAISASDRKDVLVVCPFPISGTWAKNTLDPMTELDRDKSRLNIFYSVMRNSSFKGVDDFEVQEQMIFRHYKGKRPDLIVIFGPGNYILASDFNRAWRGVPMILVGELDYVCDRAYVCDSVLREDVTRTPVSSFARGMNLTFIHTPVYCQETVDLLFTVNPNVQRMVFFGGEEYLSREIELMMSRALRYYGREFVAYHPDDASYREIALMATNSDRKTTGFVYCNWHNKDIVRDTTIPHDGFRANMERLVPLFNAYYSIIDEDSQTAGFVSYSHEEYNATVKRVFGMVANGERQPRDIPFVEITRASPVVNYSVMERMGIDMGNIPDTFEVVNRPQTVWERYRVPVLLLIVLALTGLSLLFFFLYNRQKSLLASTARYYALINNAPFNYNSSKLYFDSRGYVRDVRTLSCNLMLQKSRERHNVEFGKMTLLEAYPESAPNFIRHVAEGVSARKTAIRFTFELKEFDMYYEMLVLFDGSDVIHTFSLNVTELMHAQRDLKEAKERAENSDRMKTAFVQNVSHEIRTPLNAVVGFSQLLSLPDDIVSQDEKTQYVDYIQNNSELLIMLVNDILSVGDVERGRFVVNMGEVHCNDVCRKSMKTAEVRLTDGVNMYLTTEVGDDFTIYSDEKRIQQVLINFLTNACKHTDKGEIHVHCSTSENEGMLTLSVTDTGTGVPPEMADRIFERFTKLNAFKQGAGLGLNICKSIASKLNGEVWLDTSYTDGARFVFVLPIE